uniref:DUF4283 domain-containing protein n=1 Tax=Populus alba TaxID=43335 RepID=A0A4U5QDD5_POPAL|nr:hypothetical protein D5086_0000103250 [Populus alba]
MAKSKKKTSTLRFAQRKHDFFSLHPPSSSGFRTQRQSVSPRGQHSSSPSTSSSPPSAPPRTVITLADVMNSNCEARPDAGNPKVGSIPSPSLTMQGHTTTGKVGPSSSTQHHTGNTIPSSPTLVYFPDFTATSSCQFLETDLGAHKELWRSSLIGFIAGKFPGYSSLSQFVHFAWNCNVKLSMHDSGWLIFNFESEVDRLKCLIEGLTMFMVGC